MTSKPMGINESLDQSREAIESRLKLEGKLKSGGAWFYWIAGLSTLNSIIVLANSEWSFMFGLGITQLIQGVINGAQEGAQETLGFVQYIGFGIIVLITGLFVLFGWSARKGKVSFFYTGMILYTADSLLFLFEGDLLPFAFHFYALFGLLSGVRACRELQKNDGSAALLVREPPSSSQDQEPKIIGTNYGLDCEEISERNLSPTEPRQSGLGLASFWLSMFAFVLIVVLMIIVMSVVSQPINPEGPPSPKTVLAVLVLLIEGMAVIVAFGLGVASLFQRGKKKVFGILGLIFSGFILALGSLITLLGFFG